jgi:hypothetical protein
VNFQAVVIFLSVAVDTQAFTQNVAPLLSGMEQVRDVSPKHSASL